MLYKKRRRKKKNAYFCGSKRESPIKIGWTVTYSSNIHGLNMIMIAAFHYHEAFNKVFVCSYAFGF